MCTGSMSSRFHPDERFAVALDSVASRLDAHERVLRAGLAARYRLLAEAFDLAAWASDATGYEASRPCGKNGELAYRAVRAELAVALNVSERTIERQLSDAQALISSYPSVLDALSAGVLSEGHVQVILKAGAVIGSTDEVYTIARRHRYAEAVLEFAVRMTPARLRPVAERLAEQYAEQTIDERHEQARDERTVCVRDRDDGMSELFALLPSLEAHAIYDRLTRIARRDELVEATAAAEARREGGASGGMAEQPARATRDHRRADLLADLLMRADPEPVPTEGGAGLEARVQIIVTDRALFAEELRLDEVDADQLATSMAPTELSGRGAIDTATARRAAATATAWQLVYQHPATGEVLSVDRYRPSEQMRRLLAARDLHCRFPGCRAPAHRCDLDHTVDAANGGATSTRNLSFLCRGHHMLKHHAGWGVKQLPSGDLEWESPTGRIYRDRPPSRVRFEATAAFPTATALPSTALPSAAAPSTAVRPPDMRSPSRADSPPGLRPPARVRDPAIPF